MDAPVVLAFTAGLVATLNPCGFAMLPAYLSFFVGLGDGDGAATVTPGSRRATDLTRALAVGGVVSAAFLGVFGAVGAVLTAGVSAALLAAWLPWIAIAVGLAVVGLGFAVLRGFELRVSLPHPQSGTQGRGLRQVFAFGLSYALASLSCTLPVFLAVVAGTLTRADVVSGLVTFLAYGLGMSTVLLSLVVALALARHRLVRRLQRAVRFVQRLSGGLLIVSGTYVVYFWAYTLATGGTGRGGSAPITFVDGISARATNLVGRSGFGFGLLLLAVALGALASRLLRDPGRRRPTLASASTTEPADHPTVRPRRAPIRH
jgi:cytochrome c biogenesis protein CcdA